MRSVLRTGSGLGCVDDTIESPTSHSSQVIRLHGHVNCVVMIYCAFYHPPFRALFMRSVGRALLQSLLAYLFSASQETPLLQILTRDNYNSKSYPLHHPSTFHKATLYNSSCLFAPYILPSPAEARTNALISPSSSRPQNMIGTLSVKTSDLSRLLAQEFMLLENLSCPVLHSRFIGTTTLKPTRT